jgi:hypothetical protein
MAENPVEDIEKLRKKNEKPQRTLRSFDERI